VSDIPTLLAHYTARWPPLPPFIGTAEIPEGHADAGARMSSYAAACRRTEKIIGLLVDDRR